MSRSMQTRIGGCPGPSVASMKSRWPAESQVTVTVDSAGHLDFIDATLGPGHPPIRVCIDLDMSWRPLPYGPVVQVGTWRSPLRTPAEAALFAEAILRRPGF